LFALYDEFLVVKRQGSSMSAKIMTISRLHAIHYLGKKLHSNRPIERCFYLPQDKRRWWMVYGISAFQQAINDMPNTIFIRVCWSRHSLCTSSVVYGYSFRKGCTPQERILICYICILGN